MNNEKIKELAEKYLEETEVHSYTFLSPVDIANAFEAGCKAALEASTQDAPKEEGLLEKLRTDKDFREKTVELGNKLDALRNQQLHPVTDAGQEDLAIRFIEEAHSAGWQGGYREGQLIYENIDIESGKPLQDIINDYKAALQSHPSQKEGLREKAEGIRKLIVDAWDSAYGGDSYLSGDDYFDANFKS